MSTNFLNAYNFAITQPYEEVKKTESLALLKFKEIIAIVVYIAAGIFKSLLLLVTPVTLLGIMFGGGAITVLIGKAVVPSLALISPKLAATAIISMCLAFSALSSYLPLLETFLLNCQIKIDSEIHKISRNYFMTATQNYQQAKANLQQAYDSAKTAWKATQEDRFNLRMMNLNSQDPQEAFVWNELPDDIKNEIAGYVLGCYSLNP